MLGDPAFVDNMELYQQALLSDATVKAIRSKMSNDQVLPESAYNPDGIEILET